MDARKYLGQLRILECEIELLDERYKEAKAAAEEHGTGYGERVQTSPVGDISANRIVKYVDIERKKAVLEKRRSKIIRQIRMLGKANYAELLYLRYSEGMGLRHIASLKKYSYDRIRHMHAEALNEFQRKYLKS